MFTYTMLEQIAELYAGARLENTLLLACQHLLEPQKRMFELFLGLGLKPENCVIIGKNYSTNDGILSELRGLGCVVAPFSDAYDPCQLFKPWFEAQLKSFLAEQLASRDLSSYDKVAVLDDGGYLLCAIAEIFPALTNVFGVEQTSSGHHKVMEAKLPYPVESVARSHQKLVYETPYIGECGGPRIIQHLDARGKSDPNILVLGLGPIGSQIAGRLLIASGYRGACADPAVSEQSASRGAYALLAAKSRVIPHRDAMLRIAEFDVIVGCAGTPVLEGADIARLHPEASLISMSSSDHEFPPLPFRIKGGKVHDDCYLGRRCLANSGFPITFSGQRNEMPSWQIELTISLLMARILDGATEGKLQSLSVVIGQAFETWKTHSNALVH